MKSPFKSKPRIFLALPHYSGKLDSRALTPIICAGQNGVVYTKTRGHSLLAHNFNQLWCEALNLRKSHSLTHFVMLHDDIIPTQKNWVEILHQELIAHNADVMSVIVPQKGPTGLTSTAWEETTEIECESMIFPAGALEKKQVFKDSWACRRMTMQEVFKYPETFTMPGILVNSGCFIADIRKPWAEKILFTIMDLIIKKADGMFYPLVLSEDWNFSKQVRREGGKIYATRKVEVSHRGFNDFVNNEPWGTEAHDPLWEVEEEPEEKYKQDADAEAPVSVKDPR